MILLVMRLLHSIYLYSFSIFKRIVQNSSGKSMDVNDIIVIVLIY